MDRYPLVLLQWLKFRGILRRMSRALRSPKGIILTVIGLAVFAPQILALTVFRDPTRAMRLEGARTLGPWFLLVGTLVTLLTSGGERAVSFSPPEVAFLFPAPFGRRRLLLYKVLGALAATLLTAIFLTIAMGSNAASYAAAYFGLVLIFSYLTLLTMMVSLLGAAVGEAARTWRRRLVLGVVLVLIGAGLASSLDQLLTLEPREAFRRVNGSPVSQVLLTPFRWFTLTFTAERLWPDFAKWASLSLAVNLALLAAIMALDAQFLELAASNSERFYAKVERMRRGGMGGSIAPTLAGKGGPRKELPMLPWWGGAGPVAWRQLTTAWRDWARSLVLLLTLVGIAALGVFVHLKAPSGEPVLWMFTGTILTTSLFMTILTTFDFRSDIERIETLKTLPISSVRLALGQVAAPTAIATAIQGLALVVLGVGTGTTEPLYWSLLLFLPPFNLLLFGVENVMFLWFPTRLTAAAPGDVQALGRAMVLILAKFLVLGLTTGLAVGLGALGHYLGGWGAAAGMAWMATAFIGIALVPLVAKAFRQFDVARDTPV